MKRLLLCALLGTLSVTAGAQSESDQAVLIRGSQFELPAQPYQMFRGDINLLQGSYDMSNGQGMGLREFGGRLYATVGNQERKLLVATGRNEFVSADRQLRLALKRQDSGDYAGQLWLVGPSRIAGARHADPKYAQLLTFR